MFTYLLFLLPAVVFAQGDDLQTYKDAATHMFKTSDLDMNGQITKDELHANFLSYDTNGDGRVTRHEYTNYVDNNTPELHQLSHALYDVYDVDNDHHLDEHDYENFFVLMDSNGDRAVSMDEYVNYWVVLFTSLSSLHGDHGSHGHHGQ